LNEIQSSWGHLRNKRNKRVETGGLTGIGSSPSSSEWQCADLNRPALIPKRKGCLRCSKPRRLLERIARTMIICSINQAKGVAWATSSLATAAACAAAAPINIANPRTAAEQLFDLMENSSGNPTLLSPGGRGFGLHHGQNHVGSFIGCVAAFFSFSIFSRMRWSCSSFEGNFVEAGPVSSMPSLVWPAFSVTG